LNDDPIRFENCAALYNQIPRNAVQNDLDDQLEQWDDSIWYDTRPQQSPRQKSSIPVSRGHVPEPLIRRHLNSRKNVTLKGQGPESRLHLMHPDNDYIFKGGPAHNRMLQLRPGRPILSNNLAKLLRRISLYYKNKGTPLPALVPDGTSLVRFLRGMIDSGTILHLKSEG
jgi:hypothetical protein